MNAQMTEPTRHGVIAWMARNPVAANLLMMLLIVGGLIFSTSVKQEVMPEFDLDMVTVSVAYPGASPEEIEEGIVLAIEEEISGLDGIKKINSIAAEGFANIRVELLLGADTDEVLHELLGMSPDEIEDLKKREVLG